MAFRPAAWLHLLSLLLGPSAMVKSGAGAQEFQLLQPQGAVWVSAGETLTLPCEVTGAAPVGPVRWFKGSGSGRQLIYADVGSFPRVTRAVPGSETDYTIRLSDTRPADAGVYRCVKFKKTGTEPDKEIRSGAGTTVSLSESSLPSAEERPGPLDSASTGHSHVAVIAAAGTVCILLVGLVLVSAYFFVRKKRGRSTGTARSQTPRPDNSRAQSQPSDDKAPDVLYADLQHSAGPQQPKKSAPEEHSEYAAIRVPQAIAR